MKCPIATCEVPLSSNNPFDSQGFTSIPKNRTYSPQLYPSRVHSLARNLSSVMATSIGMHKVSTPYEATSSIGSSIRRHCWNLDLYFQIFLRHSLVSARVRLKKGIQTTTSGLSKMERKSLTTHPKACTVSKDTCKQHRPYPHLHTLTFMPLSECVQTTSTS